MLSTHQKVVIDNAYNLRNRNNFKALIVGRHRMESAGSWGWGLGDAIGWMVASACELCVDRKCHI